MTFSILENMKALPSAGRALVNYRALSEKYDATCSRIENLRLATVQELQLSAGETVFDIACGTGPLLPLLARQVGPTGKVVGVELSPEMAAQARRRVHADAESACVRVVQVSMADFQLAEKADAFLFSYTHDVLQSAAALDRLLAAAKPGARIAILGMKTLPWWWGWPVNLFNLYRARCYLTTFSNMDCPWRLLGQRGVNLRLIRTALWGSAYIAVGTFP